MEEYIKKISKILLAIAVILSFVSILLPWGEIQVTGFGGSTFYCWGINSNSLFTSDSSNQWHSYFSFLSEFNLNEIEEVNSIFIPTLFVILVIVLVLFSIGLGILSFYNVDKNKRTDSVEAGICSIGSIVCFYIFIQFGILSLSSMISPFFSYSIGFYFMIFSGIVFFIAFVLIIEFIPTKSKEYEPVEDDEFDILRKRYAKGEITKEEFEDIKKDLE